MALKSELFIKTALRGEITYLKEAFFKQPFKLADIREDKQDRTLHLMLMSSSPGILDGDHYYAKVELNEGCRLELHTQSYQRIFSMTDSASQEMRVLMKNDSFFAYLPHPCVPHEGANFTSRNTIVLAENCELLWGEVLTCGRKLNGEVFALNRFHSITEVFHHQKLIIKENLLLQPQLFDYRGTGLLEGFTHQASLIYLKQDADVATLMQKALTFLDDANDVDYGVTELPFGGLLLRILGNKAEQLHNLLKSLGGIFTLKAPIMA